MLIVRGLEPAAGELCCHRSDLVTYSNVRTESVSVPPAVETV
jgi:hypothetical protein